MNERGTSSATVGPQLDPAPLRVGLERSPLDVQRSPSLGRRISRLARPSDLLRMWRAAARRPTVQLSAANLGAWGLNMLSGLLIARSLGTVGRGQVSLVQAYDDTSTTGLSLGVPSATGYFAKEHPENEAKILGAALTISAVSLPITALLGWLAATFAFADAPTAIQLTVWAAVGLSPLSNAYPNSCRMVLVARGQITSLVPLQIAQMGIRFGTMLALVLLDIFTPTTAAVTVVVSGWCASLFALKSVKTRPERGGAIRPVLTFGLKTVPASLASMANSRLDQMLIAPLIGASSLGIYAVAVGTTFLPLSVGTAIALGGFHTVKGSDGFAGAASLLRRAIVIISGCGLVNAVGVLLLLEPIYGSAFKDAVVPALIMIPGAAATALFVVVGPVGEAIGAPALGSWAQGAGLLVTVIGLVALLPILGIVGAAIVSSVAYAARLGVGFWLLHRRGVRL